VDGQEIKRPPNAPGITPGVKALRVSWGTRFFFMRGVEARSVTVVFPEPFKVTSTQPARVGVYRFTIACVVPRCVSR
jgi:hypothetical protein